MSSRELRTTAVALGVLIAAVGVASCSSTSIHRTATDVQASCNQDMNAPRPKLGMPEVKRLLAPVALSQFHFVPAPANYRPKVPASSIWRQKGNRLVPVAGAHYAIYLARYIVPPGTPRWGGIADQNVWLWVGTHMASVVNGPMPFLASRHVKETCTFGGGMVFENADTGDVQAAAGYGPPVRST
jgi:hypothetical protein